jgi:hypothetical protein
MKKTLFLLVLGFFATFSYSQPWMSKIDSLLRKDFSVDMQWFLAERFGESNNETFNEFTLKRGYVNIKKGISENLSGRITTDITVDEEGDGEGDIEIRLKYLYLKYKINDILFLHKPYFEFGLVHRPWLDFEQNINQYRVQGTMFLERNRILNSADFGVVFMTMLGGEMDENYKKRINKKFAGKYGSFSVGVFNGGGYHALEKNVSKTLEGRFTLRPFPAIIPGLQFTYHGAYGNGNIEQEPHWHYQSAFTSFETPISVLTFETYEGKGNSGGSAIQDTISFSAVPQYGYSAFGEMKFFKSKWSLFGRYDDQILHYNSGTRRNQRFIGGIAYHFHKGSKIIVDYEHLDYRNTATPDAYAIEIGLELRF